MRRLLTLLALPVLFACSGTAEDGSRLYDNSDLELITGYTAKEMCSCLFVMERPEDFCRAWTKANPAIASAQVDLEAKVVRSSALSFWDATARFVDDRTGCVLEP